MRKVLYAASQSIGSYFQLKRISDSLSNKFEIKTAGYKNYIKNQAVNYCLDCLDHFTSPLIKQFHRKHNANYNLYLKQIESFNPDLIITELEPCTSFAAIDLNIPLWQVSPTFIYNIIPNSIFKNSKYLKNYSAIIDEYYLKNKEIILNHSSKKFIYSHISDIEYRFALKDNYEYVRPYYVISNNNSDKYNTVGRLNNKKQYFKELNTNSNIYCDFNEKYKFKTSNLYDYKSYEDSINNCDLVISEGDASTLADAFYNQKYSIIYTDFTDKESILNTYVSEYYNLGKSINLNNKVEPKQVDICINENTKFLHEEIFNFFKKENNE